jgi:hypothetical protein
MQMTIIKLLEAILAEQMKQTEGDEIAKLLWKCANHLKSIDGGGLNLTYKQ